MLGIEVEKVWNSWALWSNKKRMTELFLNKLYQLYGWSVNCELDTQIVTNRIVQITGTVKDKSVNYH
jgi:hypothetical protein